MTGGRAALSADEVTVLVVLLRECEFRSPPTCAEIARMAGLDAGVALEVLEGLRDRDRVRLRGRHLGGPPTYAAPEGTGQRWPRPGPRLELEPELVAALADWDLARQVEAERRRAAEAVRGAVAEAAEAARQAAAEREARTGPQTDPDMVTIDLRDPHVGPVAHPPLPPGLDYSIDGVTIVEWVALAAVAQVIGRVADQRFRDLSSRVGGYLRPDEELAAGWEPVLREEWATLSFGSLPSPLHEIVIRDVVIRSGHPSLAGLNLDGLEIFWRPVQLGPPVRWWVAKVMLSGVVIAAFLVPSKRLGSRGMGVRWLYDGTASTQPPESPQLKWRP